MTNKLEQMKKEIQFLENSIEYAKSEIERNASMLNNCLVKGNLAGVASRAKEIVSSDKELKAHNKALKALKKEYKDLEQETKASTSGLEILDQFLANWKEQATIYYRNLKEQLENAGAKPEKVTREGLETLKDAWGKRKLTDERIEKILEVTSESALMEKQWLSDIAYQAKKDWKSARTKAELVVVDQIGSLEKILTEEVARKKAEFVTRIQKKAGEIVEADLEIGVDGSVNGLVQGTEKTVKVTTVFAGGYNVQKLHYRVLVK